MATRSDDGHGRLPPAGKHELRQEKPPARADAFDQMRRRYSDTVKNPEEPTNVAPRSEREGQSAEVDDDDS